MGLLRGVARTAVIAGTATHVSNNVSRRQSRRWTKKQDQEQEQSADSLQQKSQSDINDQMDQLAKLGQLRDQGILTQEEFDAKKKQILEQ